jgi:hypothetical protein
VETTEEALPAGFWTDLVAEFVGESRSLSLEESGGAVDRLGGGGARPNMEVDVCCCHDIDFLVEALDLALGRHPCTSLLALQAR